MTLDATESMADGVKLGLAVSAVVALVLVAIGILASVFAQDKTRHEGFFGALNVWFGQTGVLLYLLMVGIAIVLCLLAPPLVLAIKSIKGSIDGGVSAMNNGVGALENAVKTFKTLADHIQQVPPVADLLSKILGTVGPETRQNFANTLLNLLSKK